MPAEEQHPAAAGQPQPIEIANPRYIVEQATTGDGYHIIDTTGRDKPYLINAMNSLSDYERNRVTPAFLQRHQEHSRKVAQDWAYVWNLVELGYCGSCKTLLAEIPGHANERYPAVGYNHLYRTLCFACACSQED